MTTRLPFAASLLEDSTSLELMVPGAGLVLLLVMWALARHLRSAAKQREQHREIQRLAHELACLRNSTEFRAELLAVAAHDLRGATGLSRGLADLIARDPETPGRLAEVASTIVATTAHMEQLVYRLLERAAAREDDWTVTPVRFDLGKLVEQTAFGFRADAGRKKIALDAARGQSLMVVLDPMLTAEIITNLVSNAVKFTPPGGRVELALTHQGESISIRVADTGPGISSADQARLFRPFHPLSARPTGGETSTGLGLAIAKRLAELQRGDLQLESSSPGGTVFRLTLPLQLAAETSGGGKLKEAAA